MGSFNVTCCITKTPILVKEECILLVLNKPKDNDNIFTCGEMSTFIIESYIKDVYKGKYDDYGRLLGNVHPDVTDNDEFVGLFISNVAWEYGKKLIDNPSYKGRIKYISDRHLLRENIKSLQKSLIKLNEDDSEKAQISSIADGVKGIVGESRLHIEDTKVLVCLDSFCKMNNMNMFDPSFENWYGTQSLNIKEKEEWNVLRTKRIEILKQKDKEWENE